MVETMTGNDLLQIMEKLNLSGADVGNISGMSRAYISRLLETPEETIPATTFAKLRAGFLQYHKAAADAYFSIESEGVSV